MSYSIVCYRLQKIDSCDKSVQEEIVKRLFELDFGVGLDAIQGLHCQTQHEILDCLMTSMGMMPCGPPPALSHPFDVTDMTEPGSLKFKSSTNAAAFTTKLTIVVPGPKNLPKLCKPRLRCHPEVTYDQTVPDKINL